MTTSGPVRISSDAAAAWRFGKFVTPLFMLPIAILSPLLAFADEGFDLKGFLGAEAFAVLFGLLCGYGYAWYSYARYRGVTYEVEDGVLRVRRNESIEREVPVGAILAFEMRYVVDRRSILGRPFPTSWPRGVVTYEDGRQLKRNELPPILLWGGDAARAVEEAVRAPLRDGAAYQSSEE